MSRISLKTIFLELFDFETIEIRYIHHSDKESYETHSSSTDFISTTCLQAEKCGQHICIDPEMYKNVFDFVENSATNKNVDKTIKKQHSKDMFHYHLAQSCKP